MRVSPFQAIRYDQTAVGDLAHVICPPYDVISPEQQELYYRRSNYNAIRLELPKPVKDRYRRAAATFQQWLRKGILRTDALASFYLHEHHFDYSGQKMLRRGIIARVKLAPWGTHIHPHEETSPKAKSDRLQLMRACRANFSPLLSLYHDPEGKLAPTLSRVALDEPLISFQATQGDMPDTGQAHSLWAITAPETQREISQLLSSRPIYVADGHHRYETALTYLQERAALTNGGRLSDQGFQHVMMELVDLSDKGIIILPLHRLVRGIAPSALMGLSNRLKELFSVECAPPTPNWYQLTPNSCLGILGLHGAYLLILKRRAEVSLDAMMPHNRSQVYREFAVSILNHIILDAILGGAKGLEVAYTVHLEEAQQQITEGKYQLAFLLPPPEPEIVKRVADARDRLPTKSTYFYPKVPAGLVINPLD